MRGLISEERDLWPDVSFCCCILQVNGPVTGGTYRWGEGGLQTDVLLCLQGNGLVTQWGRFSVRWEELIRGNLLYLQSEILTIPLTDSVNCESLSGPNIHYASGFPRLYRKH